MNVELARSNIHDDRAHGLGAKTLLAETLARLLQRALPLPTLHLTEPVMWVRSNNHPEVLQKFDLRCREGPDGYRLHR